jgi:hypothetical protein
MLGASRHSYNRVQVLMKAEAEPQPPADVRNLLSGDTER